MNDNFIRALEVILGGYFESGWNCWSLVGTNSKLMILDLDLDVTVEQHHIPLDENGRPAEIVFKVFTGLEETRYFRKTGQFNSWDGLNWEIGEFKEVTPRKREVVDYV